MILFGDWIDAPGTGENEESLRRSDDDDFPPAAFDQYLTAEIVRPRWRTPPRHRKEPPEKRR